MYDENYIPHMSNREKSQRPNGGYNICYDCEGHGGRGCPNNCKPDREFGKCMKGLRNKKQYNQ